MACCADLDLVKQWPSLGGQACSIDWLLAAASAAAALSPAVSRFQR